MRAFGIAFILWGGTILTSCGIIVLIGVFTLQFATVAAALVISFIAMFVTSPLLIPATFLVKLASKIPYGQAAQVCWLGFTLVLLNYLYFEALALVDAMEWEIGTMFFLTSTCPLVFMLIFKRTALKEFFSQQTTKTIL